MPIANPRSGAKKLTSSQRQYRSDFPSGFIKPQLCDLVKSPPAGDNWVHEAKLDGYRMQMQVRNGKGAFYSRRGLDWTHRFPEIARACQAIGNAIIDGEVCAVGSDGLPTFAGLTDALSAKRTGSLVYYVFDLMGEDTESLISYPLSTRKKALRQLIKKLNRGDRERVVYVDHHQGDGKAMHEAACKMGLEGIVSKRIDAPYQPNDRSGIWCKAKCRASQELVVGGWKTTGSAFRSLIVGAYRGGKFVHAGTIGTGFNARNLPQLLAALKARASAKRPFENSGEPKPSRDVHWTEPTLVIEAEIASWTSDNLVRQASYKGLREDKNANDVVVEFAHRSPPA
jgi:bifunctional non-homologous end joining protein LigD